MSDAKASELAAIVSRRREALNLSYRELAAASGLSTGAVFKLATKRLSRPPGPRTLALLAVALQIDEQVLIDAIAADIGVRRVEYTEGVRQAIYLGTADLTPDEQDLVLSLIEKLRSHGNDQ